VQPRLQNRRESELYTDSAREEKSYKTGIDALGSKRKTEHYELESSNRVFDTADDPWTKRIDFDKPSDLK
jgi:hypothetical protein